MLPLKLVKTAFSNDHYYVSMNEALKAIDGHYRMLHYPFYCKEGESFNQAQENMIRYCMQHLSDAGGKQLLDIGCGNGTVALYLAENYPFKSITGVDINAYNIGIANKEKEARNIRNIAFKESNAQNLEQIPNNSVDTVFNLESAFHYPDKQAFFNEVERVLKPGGEFLIADILTTQPANPMLKGWRRKMHFHHWYLENYLKGLDKSNLILNHQEDISSQVIEGFQNYKDYIKGFNLPNTLSNRILKLFFAINARVVIKTLTQKRQYVIFKGEKPN